MFSSRTNWDLRPNRIAELLAEKRKQGAHILDLTESNPTRCGFSYDPRLTLDPLATRRSMTYEPDPKGLPAARLAVSEYYASQGIHLDADRILLTSTTSEGYSFLFRLLCSAGDRVLFPRPSYPLFEHLTGLNDVDARFYRLQYDAEWHIDFESLESLVTPNTRAIVLVHPNNPTGSYITQEEWERVEQLAARSDCAVIIDEVFASFEWTDRPLHRRSFAQESNALTFTLNGLSKLAGLPQMKLAWVTVSGPRSVAGSALERLELIGDTILSVGTPVQQALPLLLQNAEHVGNQIRQRIRANLQLLQPHLASTAASLLHGEGGWNAIVRIPNTRTDEAWALELLSSHNILVHPGYFFGCDNGEYLILSLLSRQEVIETALRLIAEVFTPTAQSP